jgi:hypothetical protein
VSAKRGTTHHVGRRKIAHDKLVLVLAHDSSYFVRDAVHAHLGLQVVRCHLGRVDKEPLFVLELLLDAAVEEECHVRVFLRLCVRWSIDWMYVYARRRGPTSDVRLLDVVLCEPFRQHVRHCLGRVGYREREIGTVARHGSYMLPTYIQISIIVKPMRARTRSLGSSTSMGLSSAPRTVLISRIRSER